MSGRQRRVLATPALIAAAAVACWSSPSPQLLLGVNAFVGTGLSAFWWCGLRPGETCSNIPVGSSGNGDGRRSRQRTQNQQHHSSSQRSWPRYRDNCRELLPIAWSPLSMPSCRSSGRFRLFAGNGGDASAESSEQGKDDDNTDEGNIDDDQANITSGGTSDNGVGGRIGQEGAEANDEEDRETGGVSVTDDQLSGLYGRISAMRERDVELDRVCAHNWRHGTCSHVLLFQATDPVQHVAWAGDELSFGTEGGGTWIISRSTGHVVNVFEGHDGDVTALFFDGRYVITGGSDKTVRVQRNRRTTLQNEQLGDCMHVLSGHTERVTGVERLGRDRFASASVDGTLRVWDLETGNVLHELILPSPAYCLGAADGYMVTGLMDGSVIAWEARNPNARPRDVLKLEAHDGAVSALSFPTKDVLLTGGGDGLVKFWDLANGGAPVVNRYEVDGQSITHAFRGHSSPVCAVQSDEHRVVSAAVDGTVAVWDIRSGKQLFQICGHERGIHSLQFDREYLVTDGTGENLFLHDFTGRRGVPATIGRTDPKDQPPIGDRDGRAEGGGGLGRGNLGGAGLNPGWGAAGLYGLGGVSESGIEDFPEGDEPGSGRPGGDSSGY